MQDLAMKSRVEVLVGWALPTGLSPSLFCIRQRGAMGANLAKLELRAFLRSQAGAWERGV